MRDVGFAAMIGLPIMVEWRKVLLATAEPGSEVGLAGGVLSCMTGGGVLGNSGASGTGELGGVGGLSSKSSSSTTTSALSSTVGGGWPSIFIAEDESSPSGSPDNSRGSEWK